MSGTSDSVIVVGAASKGIIQRDHQHNAQVYKTYYAPNPFDNMSEDEIEKYKSDIERKARGETGGKSAGCPSELSETYLTDRLILTTLMPLCCALNGGKHYRS